MTNISADNSHHLWTSLHSYLTVLKGVFIPLTVYRQAEKTLAEWCAHEKLGPATMAWPRKPHGVPLFPLALLDRWYTEVVLESKV